MPLSKIELKTLIILANYGPLSGYDLHSKKSKDGAGAAETVIMSDVHWLSVRKNLIESNLIVELERMGRRKPYKLSVDGFDLILRTHLSEINDFDTFALNYEEYFPLVFSLWGDLKKHGLDDYVKNGVAEIIQRIYVDLFSEFALKVRGRYSHDEFIENISARIYLPDLYIGGEDDFDMGIIDKINIFSDSIPVIEKFIKEQITTKENKLHDEIERINQVKINHRVK